MSLALSPSCFSFPTFDSYYFNFFILCFYVFNMLKEKASKIRLEILGEMIKGSLMDGPTRKGRL